MREVDVEVHRGRASALHALDPFAERRTDRPAVWLCEPTEPAIVLGSRQRPELLDLAACERAGLEIARRRSGGGAVLLRPGDVVWIDLIAPVGLAPDDVRGSMLWAGAVWADALATLGVGRERVAVHGGGMVCPPWSDLVCFAGLGPGEVLVDERKLVGLSQRRTRHGIRVQAQVHRRAIVGETAGLFAGSTPDVPIGEPAVLADAGLDAVSDRALADALADAFAGRMTPL